MTSEKLLPCPFCGGKAVMNGDDHSLHKCCRAHCTTCSASTGRYFNTRDEATAAWNRRAAPPAETGEVGRRVVLGHGNVDVSPIRLGRHFGVVFRPSDHPNPVGDETARPDMEEGTSYKAHPDDVVIWFEGPDNLAALETVIEQINVARAHLAATPVDPPTGECERCRKSGGRWTVNGWVPCPACSGDGEGEVVIHEEMWHSFVEVYCGEYESVEEAWVAWLAGIRRHRLDPTGDAPGGEDGD